MANKLRRTYFLPWKHCVCFLSFGLFVATIVLLDLFLPGDTTDAATRQVSGGTEFTVKNPKEAWIGVAFFPLFFGYPTLLMWWFWGDLYWEHTIVHKRRQAESQNSRIAVILTYGIVGPLVAIVVGLIVYFLVFFSVLHPLNSVHRITVKGDNVVIDSLYRRWQISKQDIQDVDMSRKTDESHGRSYAGYKAIIRLKNGNLFRTALDVRAYPAGGEEDRRYENFFADLKEALAKKL